MSTENHKDIQNNIPAYVLGALEPEEAQKVANHLETCRVCTELFSSYQAVGDQLGLAAAESIPSGYLKTRIMDRVLADTGAENRAAGTFWGRLRGSIPQFPPVVTYASAVLILVLAVSNLVLWQELGQLRAANNIPFQTISLSGTAANPKAVGVILVSAGEKEGMLVAESLTPLSPEQQYQLWLILNGERTSGGVFSVSEDGYAALSFSAPIPIKNYASFGITIEPSGGSTAPTGDKVLGGEL